MRENLRDRLGEMMSWTADIEKFREFVKDGIQIREYLLKNICNEWGTLKVDHLVWRLGRDVPALPLVYGRLGPGARIKFSGKIVEYKKHAGSDYNIKLIKLDTVERYK